MVLADSEILLEHERGMIVISPFNREYLNPNSVDLTLNPKCKVYIGETLDCRKPSYYEGLFLLLRTWHLNT